MALKTAASLGKEKYERIGQTEAKKIIGLVSNYSARSGMKPVVKSLGTSRVSVLKFLKKFNKSTDIDKVVRAAQKHFNEDIDPEIQKGFMKANMQRDDSFFKERKYNNSNKNISILGKAGGGIHGDASRLGVVSKAEQRRISALNPNSNRLPAEPAKKEVPPAGIRPIGL